MAHTLVDKRPDDARSCFATGSERDFVSTAWRPVLEGEGVLTLDDERHLMRPHDFVYVPPGVRHSFHNTGTAGLVFLVITTPASDDEESL